MSVILEIIDRIKIISNLKSDKEVADILEIKADTLSQWKKRNKIPYKELSKYSNLQNVSLNWLLSEKGNMLLNNLIENKEKKINYKNEIMNNLEKLEEKQIKKIYHIIEIELLK